MRYRESTPSPRLAEYIKLFWSLEYVPAGYGEIESVLPDGCPEMVFNLSDRFTRLCGDSEELQPATLFAGQMSRKISIRPSGKVCLFGVRFHPAGSHPLSRFPMRELNDEILEVETFIGRDGVELEERVNLAQGFNERVSLFQGFFSKRLAAANLNTVSTRAVRTIVKMDGSISVAALADQVGSSERALERAFRRDVGISPKMLARIVRFQALINLIQKTKTPGSLDASLELGYFDQSHAIHDFREFAGMTPLGYFQSTHGVSDLFTGSHL